VDANDDIKGNKNEVMRWGHKPMFLEKRRLCRAGHFLSQNDSVITHNPFAFQAVYKLPAHTGAIRLRPDS